VSGRPLLFVTPWPPWPLDNGTRIRNARLAQGLAREFDLTLVTFADGPPYDDETHASRPDLEALLPAAAAIELVPYDTPRPHNAPGEIGQRASATWGRYATPGLRAALTRILHDRNGCVLHLDGPGPCLAGLGLAPGRTVYASHNIEHRIWRDVAHRRPAGQRQYLELEWRKIEREERRCWLGADLCLAVSDIDAETMRAGGARRVALAPNGTDPCSPLPPALPKEREPLRLLFVGNGAFWPYAHGLEWFAREVMPLLRTRRAAVLDVVGALPADPVAGPGITYHGRVPDVAPFYDAAHALVVPVFEGSGTRLKIIEAAFLGRPVISTELGAEGLPIRAGEHYARAQSAEEWIAAIEQLRGGALVQMAERARQALRDLTWTRIAAALAETYRQLPSSG
jgi:glycosyltransferase involved in cell wall biosynthesis